MNHTHHSAAVAFLILFTASAARAGDWPGWRGPTGQGVSDEKDLPLTWNGKTGDGVLWKVRLPGQDAKAKQDQNQSSPIVVKGKVFLSASYWPAGTVPGKEYPEHHVVCYDAADGKQLWDVTVKPGPWKLTDLRGGYTVPTPACDSERLYVVFGSAVIAALDLEGKPVWRQEIVPFDFDVTLAPSPVVYGETVLLHFDCVKKTSSRLVALDRKTGAVKWEENRPQNSFSHSTPVVARIGERDQLLVPTSNGLQGVDPDNGKLLWWCAGNGDTVSPVFGAGVVYVDSGRGGSGIAVDPTGSGDVSKTHLKWKMPGPESFASPVIVGDHLYRLNNSGVLKCIKLATGEVLSSERLEGVSTASSPFTTPDGRIYLASAGKTYVLKAGPKPEVLAVNDLGDGTSPQESPSAAAAGGRIYLRGRQYLYCIGKK